MFTNMSVKYRLISLILIPVVFFIVATVFTLAEVKTLQHDIDSLFDDRVIPMQELKVVSDDYTVVIANAFHKIRSGSLTEAQGIQVIKKARDVAKKEWKKYLKTEHNAKEKKLMKTSEILQKNADALIDDYIQIIKNGTFQSIEYSQFVSGLYSVLDPLSENFNGLVQAQLEQAKELKEEGDREAELVKKVLITSSIGIVLVVSFLGAAIYRSINAPLSQLEKTISYIAERADLTKRADVQNDDEISSISLGFNRMMERIQGLVNNLQTTAVTLNTSSDEMSSLSAQMASTAQEQEQQTATIATAVTQMSTAIQEVSKSSVKTAEKAESVDSLSQKGQNIVTENIESINKLTKLVLDNANLINELNQQSNEINQVVLMIQGVAEQTNLLALNAAIEAARAGDSGRGFAVVADEVRQLAHNTQKATESINEMITKLQAMAQNAVNEMSTAEQTASTSIEKAQQSSEVIDQITSAISEIVDMNMQVSTATEQQTTVATEISASINEFNESITYVSKNAQKNADSSSELAHLSTQLKDHISEFKTQ